MPGDPWLETNPHFNDEEDEEANYTMHPDQRAHEAQSGTNRHTHTHTHAREGEWVA